MSTEDNNNKNEEATLPKTTLISYIKECLAPYNLKCEKLIFDIIEKISISYINHISNISTQICVEKGKKTLNVDHVIEALKKLKFDNYLKNICTENLNLSEENEENTKEIVEKDPLEMKDLINKKKKRKTKKKKNFDVTQDLMNQQLELFEKSKSETFNLYLNNLQNGLTNTNGNGNSHGTTQPASFNHIFQKNHSNNYNNKEIDFDDI